MGTLPDYYEILQVSPHAEPEIILAAYRRLAMKYHPDYNKSPGAEDRLKLINAAYEILGNTDKRAFYDWQRRPIEFPYRPPQPSMSPKPPSPPHSQDSGRPSSTPPHTSRKPSPTPRQEPPPKYQPRHGYNGCSESIAWIFVAVAVVFIISIFYLLFRDLRSLKDQALLMPSATVSQYYNTSREDMLDKYQREPFISNRIVAPAEKLDHNWENNTEPSKLLDVICRACARCGIPDLVIASIAKVETIDAE